MNWVLVGVRGFEPRAPASRSRFGAGNTPKALILGALTTFRELSNGLKLRAGTDSPFPLHRLDRALQVVGVMLSVDGLKHIKRDPEILGGVLSNAK